MRGEMSNLLEVSELKKTYANGFQAVKGVSFSIKEGECLGLVGESGSGKSTLARCILMLEKISAGDIRISGKSLIGMDKEAFRHERLKMQAVFQNPNSALNNKMKIIDSLMEPLDHQKDNIPSFLKGFRFDRRAVAKYLMEMVNLQECYLDYYPHQLSGGQKQRVTIARAISVEPALIVLDEPTASLDVSIQARVLNLLKDLQEQLGLTYFFISHDLSAVNFMSHNTMVMYQGEIVDRFSNENIFSEDRHEYTKILMDVFES